VTTETRPLRIVHLSDTHLFGDGTLHYGLVDTTAALRRVLDRAAALEQVDVVVLSGDLSNDGSPASYGILRDLVEPWAAARGAVVVYAMGNHDLRAAFEQMLGERRGVVTVHGVRVIHLDSSVPRYGYGELEAASLQWLREELATPAPSGTVVVLHHPPVPASTPLLAALELERPRDLLDVCEQADVRLILSGHYHHSLVTSAGGIPVVVAPGITNTSDAIAPPGHERATVGAGFALIDLPPAVADAPRVTIISAPGPDDGAEVFDIDSTRIAEIAREAGKPPAPGADT